MSYTPGPWMINGKDEIIKGYEITDTVSSQAHDGDEASEYIATAYDMHNARLIAAAPEMLEALIALCSDKHTLEMAVGQGIDIIEKSTGKTWEEIREEENDT